jgi:hypothetical protein
MNATVKVKHEEESIPFVDEIIRMDYLWICSMYRRLSGL